MRSALKPLAPRVRTAHPKAAATEATRPADTIRGARRLAKSLLWDSGYSKGSANSFKMRRVPNRPSVPQNGHGELRSYFQESLRSGSRFVNPPEVNKALKLRDMAGSPGRRFDERLLCE